MKRLSAAVIFFSALFAAMAQTNVPALPDTNIPITLETNFAGIVVREMSLQDCLQEALAHNFDVQIQRLEPQISLYGLNGAYAGYDPTLTASGTHSRNVSGGGLGPSLTNTIPASISKSDSFRSGLGGSMPWGMTYSLNGNVSDNYGTSGGSPFERSSGSISANATQPLLKNFWIDNTRLSIRVSKLDLKTSEQKWRGQLITSVTAVINAYYELIFARENLKVKEDALDLAQTQLRQDRQRSQIGTIAELDVQQDEAHAAQGQADLIAAAGTLSGAENTLKGLLTDDYKAWHAVDIQPSATLAATRQALNLQDSWDKGMSQRPDLLEARYALEQQGIRLKYYRNQLFPELDLIGTYGYNGSATEFNGVFDQYAARNRPFYSYGAQLSVPLGSVGSRNQYKSAKATLQQVLLQLKQSEQKALQSIDSAVADVYTKYESVVATRQARVYAQAALDAEQKKYDVGKSTTFTVLQLQNNLTAARSQEIRALADYNESLANLASEEGSTLEQNQISFDLRGVNLATGASGK